MFVVIYLLTLVLVLIILKRKLYSPEMLFSSLWFFLTFLYMIFSSVKKFGLKSLSLETQTLLILFVSLFVFSFLSACQLIPLRKSSLKIKLYKGVKFETYLVIITAFAMPGIYFKAREISELSGLDNFLMGLRYSLNYLDGDFGFYKYFGTLSIFVTIILYSRLLISETQLKINIKKIRTLFIISLTVCLYYQVLSTGRTSFLLLIISLATINAILKGNLKKGLFVVAGFMGAIFIINAIIYAKGYSNESSLSDNLFSIADVFVGYLLSPLAALNYYVNNISQHQDYTWGGYVFRFILSFLDKVGLYSGEILDLKQPYVFVPYETNVYTMFYIYLRDFGVFGTGIILSILGGVYAFIYKSIELKRLAAVTFYSISLFPLVISFYQEMLFTILSIYIQYIILFFIYVWVKRNANVS